MTTDPLHTTTLVDAVANVGGWMALSAGGAIAAGTAVASLRRGFDGLLRRPRARRTAGTQPSAWRRRVGASTWRRQVGATAGLLTAAVGAAATTNPAPAGATAESGAAANHTTVSGGAPQLRVVDGAPDVTDPAVDGPSATAAPSTAAPSIAAPSTEAPSTEAPSTGPVPAAAAGSLPEGNDVISPAPPAAPAAPPASPAAITAPEAPGRIHRVADGEHFWSIATEQVRARLGRPPGDDEVVRYWMVLIDANRDRLADPADPDLIHPGLELLLPEVRPVT